LQGRISGIFQEISSCLILYSHAIAFIALFVGFGILFLKIRKDEDTIPFTGLSL
jgi:hypothetical protein